MSHRLTGKFIYLHRVVTGVIFHHFCMNSSFSLYRTFFIWSTLFNFEQKKQAWIPVF